MIKFNKKDHTMKYTLVVDSKEWIKAIKETEKLAKEQSYEIKDIQKDLWMPTVELYLQKNSPKLLVKLQEEHNVTVFMLENYKIVKISAEELEIEYKFAYYENKEDLKVEFQAKIEKPSKDTIKRLTEQEIAKFIQRKIEKVSKDEASVSGDKILFDFIGKKDDVPFEGGSAENYELELGAGQFIPSLENQLIGLKKGDKKDLDVVFPDDYHSEDLKGQKVVFSVNIKDVFNTITPKFNDELVQTLNIEKVNNTKEFTKFIEKEQTFIQDVKAGDEFLKRALAQIAQSNNFEIHPLLFAKRVESTKIGFEADIAKNGFDKAQYLEMINMTEESFEEVINEKVKSDTMQISIEAILTHQIVKEVTKKNIDTVYTVLALSQGISVDELKKYYTKEDAEIWAKHYALIDILSAKNK